MGSNCSVRFASFYGRRKKKELKQGVLSPSQRPLDPNALPNLERVQTYKSIFDVTQRQRADYGNRADSSAGVLADKNKHKSEGNFEDEDWIEELERLSPWDLAMRYHELGHILKSKQESRGLAHELKKICAEALLKQAREILGSIVRPVIQKSEIWDEVPSQAFQVELDLEETIENSPVQVAALHDEQPSEGFPTLTGQDIWMSFGMHRMQSIILAVDTSLSMTGKKLALTAVALAVVLLEFPDDPIGMVAFENEARILKRPDERIGVEEFIERFLDVPAQGYTHLESGLTAALDLVENQSSVSLSRPPSSVLLSDGKYTAGRDPTYLASRFPHLVVLKMGSDRASLQLCQNLASGGGGSLKEIDDLDVLPSVMYGVLKDILRGQSVR